MYLAFYGLNEKPFATTPDPRFLYLSPGHREALAHLVYGVQESMGFLVLTGEVGTGKTMLLHALRQRLEGKAPVAFIVNSRLSFADILGCTLEDFGVVTAEEAWVPRVFALRRFLVERGRAGQNVVVILDEAHHLDPGTLEHIRLLSTFESPTQRLLQIVLVGQPELKLTLDLPELHQLKQRIALRAVLPALSPQDTREYIRRRLSIAGARDLGLFTDRAIRRIAAYTRGIPRMVNTVCDHCLLVGYADQTRSLDVDIVKQAVRYFEDGIPARKGPTGVNWRRWWPRDGLAAGRAAVRPDNGLPTLDIERPSEAASVPPVRVPVEPQSPVGHGEDRGFLERHAVAVGLAAVGLGGVVLVGSCTRLWVQQHPAAPRATVVAPRQAELATTTIVPPRQPEVSRVTGARPDPPERPRAAIVSPSQSGLPRATVATPPEPERPEPAVVPPPRPMLQTTTADRLDQPEVPQAARVRSSQPPVGNDTAEIPRSASMSESNTGFH